MVELAWKSRRKGRMSSYRKTVEKLNEAHVADGRSPCLRCKAGTLPATLSQYGGRCQACFDAFCLEPIPAVNMQAPKAPNVMRDEKAPVSISKVQAETSQRVRDYAKRNKLTLGDSATLLQGGRP